jgi:hypothetical protein
MNPVHFQVVVGQDQVIRPPVGIALPEGKVEVTVRALADEPAAGTQSLASTRDWLLELAAESERSAPGLPSDMAEHHDHYAHGTPRTTAVS